MFIFKFLNKFVTVCDYLNHDPVNIDVKTDIGECSFCGKEIRVKDHWWYEVEVIDDHKD